MYHLTSQGHKITKCTMFSWTCLNLLLKETHTFKAYYTESYKYWVIIAGNNIKISKTQELLNKILFSLCPSFCLLRLMFPVAFLNGRGFSFLKYSTPRILNVTSHNSCCISGLKIIFSKFSQLDITACIKSCV